ncbi:hypothetical protein [Longitalea arenae]|uniref:hypothetical protein n=1 Tax=Longitalea arenae TaxID=2812558 RepID=UPI00196785E4|nr:hypothetical protein [Longitalea arenae]
MSIVKELQVTIASYRVPVTGYHALSDSTQVRVPVTGYQALSDSTQVRVPVTSYQLPVSRPP